MRVGWLSIVLCAVGCTLTSPGRSACESTFECQVAFGATHQCHAGTCESSNTLICASNDECADRLGAGFICGLGTSRCEPETDLLCDDSEECRAQLGFGFVCLSAGFCGEDTPPLRCERTFPADLLTNPSANTGRRLIGVITAGDVVARAARARVVENVASLLNGTASLAPNMGLPDGSELGVVSCASTQSSDFDELTSLQAAEMVARYMADNLGVRVIIGPSTNEETEAVFTALRGSAVLISPSAGGLDLVNIDNPSPSDEMPGLLWRTAISDDQQISAMTAVLDACEEDLGAVVVGVAYRTDAFGTAMFERLRQRLSPSSLRSFPYDSETSQTGAVDAMIASSEVDLAILFETTEEGFQRSLLRLQAAPGWAGRPVMMSAGAAIASLASATPAQSIVFGVRPQRIAAGDYGANFSAVIPLELQSVPFIGETSDAAALAAHGLAWAILQEDAVTARNVARGLRHLSDSSAPPPDTWAAANIRFEAGQGVDFDDGTTGPLNFDPATEEQIYPENLRPVTFYRYEDSQVVDFPFVPACLIE